MRTLYCVLMLANELRNINPLHLILENDILNQSRKFHALLLGMSNGFLSEESIQLTEQ